MSIKDLGSKDIRCSSCHKKLMSIINITSFGDDTPSHFVKATCPFCGGESDWIEIPGTFKMGPVPEVNEDRSINYNSTVIKTIEKVSDTESIFHIMKRFG